ncbi:Uncharacterised protein [Mycobacteroides abscessus subsp. abscessus]|nr:Uncharacterised protein [Mycobacteroides abscessus subsp. abscessus]
MNGSSGRGSDGSLRMSTVMGSLTNSCGVRKSLSPMWASPEPFASSNPKPPAGSANN